MTAPSLSAIDALARGFANVRANRELVLVQVASGLLLAASIVVPLLYFFVRLGVPLKAFTAGTPEALAQSLAEMEVDFAQLASTLGLGLLVMLVVGTIVFILHCWFQAGTLAVLLAGEAQAPPARTAPAAVFRTFSWSGFVGWASRYGLRIFWVVNLFLLLILLLLLLASLPFLFAAGLSGEEFSLVGCLIGCGLALPIGFALLVIAMAMMVAQICAVEEGSTALGSFRRGFRITGNRLGGLLLLYLLAICGSLAVSTFFGAVGLLARFALGGFPLAHSLLSAGLGVVELVLGVCVTLLMTAAAVALVRCELRRPPAAAPPVA